MLRIKYVIENKLQNNSDCNAILQPYLWVSLNANTTSKKPGATKTMCLKPLTSLLIPKPRLTLTCKC